jgi:hypothetical protein
MRPSTSDVEDVDDKSGAINVVVGPAYANREPLPLRQVADQVVALTARHSERDITKAHAAE